MLGSLHGAFICAYLEISNFLTTLGCERGEATILRELAPTRTKTPSSPKPPLLTNVAIRPQGEVTEEADFKKNIEESGALFGF